MAKICICVVMLGVGGEIVHLAHPLCDWHGSVCASQPESPVHVHTDIGTPNLATSTG
jgi:hypothetical protein